MTRRGFLSAFATMPLLAHASGQGAPAAQKPKSHIDFFDDETISYEAMRALGYTTTGGGDVMEILQALDGIDSNPETWYTAWFDLGTMVEKWGDESLAKGHGVSARDCYLRAAMYHRSSGFWMTITPKDPRNMSSFDKAVSLFRKGLPWTNPRVLPVSIPYEGTVLEGYFMRGVGTTRKQPLLILHTGFDGIAEEIYFCAVPYLQRGYSVLIFDGPGQGAALRKRGLHFRPDWETPVHSVIDFAEKLPDVSLDKLAIMGFSFGGYLAPRAASGDDRIKYCVANGGVFDMYNVFTNHFPPEFLKLMDTNPEEFNKEVMAATKEMLGLSWSLGNGFYTFGVSTPSELLTKLKPYTMKDAAGKIKAETLVIDSEGDTMMPNQAKNLYDGIKAPKTWLPFTKAEGAQLHCQVGATLRSAQRVGDWLDERIKK